MRAGVDRKAISSHYKINNGEPTLKGTRIAPALVADLLVKGWTFAQVKESYPHLSLAQVATAFWWGQGTEARGG